MALLRDGQLPFQLLPLSEPNTNATASGTAADVSLARLATS